MARFKVLVSDTVFTSFDIERDILGDLDAELHVLNCERAEELVPHMADVDVLLNTYLPGMGAEVFDAAPRLKAVVRYGIGVDTVDVPEATRRGIRVINVPDYCVEEVADHALAHFLCLARKVALASDRVKQGEWSLECVKPLRLVSEMTCGIIGFGRIGRAIAGRLKGFGPNIVFFDPALDADAEGSRSVDLDTLLRDSHAVFVQCPSTPETRHLLNRAAVAKMKQKPLVINTARGAIVDTDAIVWGLQEGLLSGAGLDLLEDPDVVVGADHPLKTLPNVLLTPHTAWYSESAIGKLQRGAAKEVARVLRGERPRSLINPEVMEGEDR